MSLPGRTVLHAASIFCILGLTSSLVHLQLFGSEPETDSSGFRSRSLLSAADAGSIKVRPVRLMGFWLAASCLAVLVFLKLHPHLLSRQAFTKKEIIGFTIGSFSSVLYLCSRLPQMYTNVSMTKLSLLWMWGRYLRCFCTSWPRRSHWNRKIAQ